MTGLIFGIALTLGSFATGQNDFNQAIIDNYNGLEIADTWTGCDSTGFIASHNYKAIGLIALRLKVGDTFDYRGCTYKVNKVQVYDDSTIIQSILPARWIAVQTCYDVLGKNRLVYAEKTEKKVVKNYQKTILKPIKKPWKKSQIYTTKK